MDKEAQDGRTKIINLLVDRDTQTAVNLENTSFGCKMDYNMYALAVYLPIIQLQIYF